MIIVTYHQEWWGYILQQQQKNPISHVTLAIKT